MIETRQRRLMTGGLAELLDVHPATIRRWERERVIPRATRRRGRRVYTDEDVERIRQAVYATPAADTTGAD